MSRSKIKSPATQFLSDRVHFTHDIVHVLTGYGTDKCGELAVQAFCLGQMPSGIHLAIITAGLVNILREDLELIPEAFEAISHAYLRGQHTSFILGVPWEELWHRSLSGLQKNMKLSDTLFQQVAA